MSKAFANAWYIRTNDVPRPKRHGACVSFRDSFPFRVPTSSVQTGLNFVSVKYTPQRTQEIFSPLGLIGMLQVLDHLVKHRPEPQCFKAKNNDIFGLDKVGHPLDLWKPFKNPFLKWKDTYTKRWCFRIVPLWSQVKKTSKHNLQ